jgi:hypothetical protein
MMFESPDRRSVTTRSVGCCFSGCWHWSCLLCHCGTVSSLYVCSILCADLSEPIVVFLWAASCIAHRSTFRQVRSTYVMHCDRSDFFQALSQESPFSSLYFTVLLDSMTFATTLIILTNLKICFSTTARSCENNSATKMTPFDQPGLVLLQVILVFSPITSDSSK